MLPDDMTYRALTARMVGCYIVIATTQDAHIRSLFRWELDRLNKKLHDALTTTNRWVEYD